MSDLVLVPVPGTNAPLQATWVDGEPFVALRPMCEGIGIDYRAPALQAGPGRMGTSRR